MTTWDYVMSGIALLMSLIAFLLTPFVIVRTRVPRVRSLFDRHLR